MDIEKIGKFIAQRRKDAELTQAQLGQTLGISDRAVSKWERGKSLPDASIMLELCDLLKITVNDLLSGEVVEMENYNKELENKLIETIKEKEKSDRRLLAFECVIGILSCIILIVPCFLGAFLPSLSDAQRILIVFSGFIPGLIGFGFAIRIEQVAGYYKCQYCGHRYVPTYLSVISAPHINRTRYMKCPKCHKSSWQKKVIEK